jgi:hypothetical protein
MRALSASSLSLGLLVACGSVSAPIEPAPGDPVVAIARCFVRRVPDFRSATMTTENLTAARRTDCSPLYR